MMFSFATRVLLYALLHLNLGSVNGLCLPCWAPFGGGKIGSYTSPGRRSVFSPRIIEPSARTIWTVGSIVNVTWGTGNMPKDVTNPTGRLLLGQMTEGDENEHLDFGHPLAAGFCLGDGHVECIVPKVDPDRNYIVILMGDSGNRSPAFEITHTPN